MTEKNEHSEAVRELKSFMKLHSEMLMKVMTERPELYQRMMDSNRRVINQIGLIQIFGESDERDIIDYLTRVAADFTFSQFLVLAEKKI